MSQAGSTQVQTRALAVLGDATDINTWSNIPYFLYHTARARGFLTHALDLMDPDFRRRRFWWNLLAPLRLESPGGYQNSRVAIERMWHLVPEGLRSGEILSHAQFFPPLDLAQKAGTKHSFYVDTTLKQLYSASVQQPRIGRRTLADTFARERDLYQSAHRFVCMARASALYAIEHYGLNPEKVHVVRPGANIDEVMVQEYLTTRGPSWRITDPSFTMQRPARLGFIGRGYKRKGLLRLIEAAEILHARGRPVKVRVIGRCPEHLQRHPLVEAYGLIRKGTHMAEFIRAIDDFAFGCLPSYAEPLGISTLECLRMGIPVMGTRVGGIPDCVPPEAGFLVDGDATGPDLAAGFERYLFDPDAYTQLVRGAMAHAETVTWDRAVDALIKVFDHPELTNIAVSGLFQQNDVGGSTIST